MTASHQRELGERLRRIRNQQGITLQEVEERSGGEWKAVVVGSYERGDRAISIPKLARLADFYGVPVAEFLPGGAGGEPGEADARGRVVVDLATLDADADGCLGAVARYARSIQLHRGDFNGRMLTIRGDDVEAIAATCGLSSTELVEELDRLGALVRS